MSKRMTLPILLILAGVSTGMLVIFAYAMSGGRTSITGALLTAAVVCIVTGSVLAFSRLLDRFVKPFMDELQADIDDDLQDLKERRLTSTFWMVLFVGIALFVFSFFVFRFHKLEAMWGSVPVVIPTFIAVALLAWYLPRTRWFKGFNQHTPMWVFFIPTFGLVLSMWLGLTRTENLGILRAPRQETIGFVYNQFGSRAVEQGANGLDFFFSFVDLPDCDNDVCGVIFMVVLLVVLTVVLVGGSASIPHFWLFSGSILLGIMVLIALHDVRLRKPSTDLTTQASSDRQYHPR